MDGPEPLPPLDSTNSRPFIAAPQIIGALAPPCAAAQICFSAEAPTGSILGPLGPGSARVRRLSRRTSATRHGPGTAPRGPGLGRAAIRRARTAPLLQDGAANARPFSAALSPPAQISSSAPPNPGPRRAQGLGPWARVPRGLTHQSPPARTRSSRVWARAIGVVCAALRRRGQGPPSRVWPRAGRAPAPPCPMSTRSGAGGQGRRPGPPPPGPPPGPDPNHPAFS